MPIELPDSMFAAPEPEASTPPPDPAFLREQQISDTTRAEQGLNQFLTAKQNMLFEAPDAFYRQQGEDAIHAAPVTTQQLAQLRADLLDRMDNDAQRNRLGEALDAQMQLAREDMARHVSEQSLAWQRQVARDRIALLTKEAAFHHNDHELVDAIGTAASNTAHALGGIGDIPLATDARDAAAAEAGSSIFNAAIQAHFDRGNVDDAATMLERFKDRLVPAHAEALNARVGNGGDPNIVLAQDTSGQAGSLARAANEATRAARPGIDNYGGYCATAVINALNKEGYEVPPVPGGAKTMGPGLRREGFEQIVPSTGLAVGSQTLPDGYTPRTGDVIVIDNPTSSGNNGHTAIYNGTDWVSDTVQSGPNPYARGTSTISVYRHR